MSINDDYSVILTLPSQFLDNSGVHLPFSAFYCSISSCFIKFHHISSKFNMMTSGRT